MCLVRFLEGILIKEMTSFIVLVLYMYMYHLKLLGLSAVPKFKKVMYSVYSTVKIIPFSEC